MKNNKKQSINMRFYREVLQRSGTPWVVLPPLWYLGQVIFMDGECYWQRLYHLILHPLPFSTSFIYFKFLITNVWDLMFFPCWAWKSDTQALLWRRSLSETLLICFWTHLLQKNIVISVQVCKKNIRYVS